MPVTTQGTDFPVLNWPADGETFIRFVPMQQSQAQDWRMYGSTFAPCVNDDRVMVVWNERVKASVTSAYTYQSRVYIGYSQNAAVFTTVEDSVTDIRTLVHTTDNIVNGAYYGFAAASVSLVDGVHYLVITYGGDGVNDTITYDGVDPFPSQWGSYLYQSTDDGATWDYVTKFPNYAFNTGGDAARMKANPLNNNGKIQVIPRGTYAGRWIASVITRRNTAGTGQPVNWPYFSDDNGATWTRSTTTPPSGGTPQASRQNVQFGFGDGDEILTSRLSGNSINQEVSSDGGDTWSSYKSWAAGSGIFFGNGFPTVRLEDPPGSMLYALGWKATNGPPVVYESPVVSNPELPFGSAGDYSLIRTYLPATTYSGINAFSDYIGHYSNFTEASTSIGAWVINNWVLGAEIGSEGVPGVLATIFCDGESNQSCCTIPDIGWNHLWSAESLNLETGQDVSVVPDLTGNGLSIIDLSPQYNALFPNSAAPPRFIAEGQGNGCPAVELIWDKSGPSPLLRLIGTDFSVMLGQPMPVTFVVLAAPSAVDWLPFANFGAGTDIPLVQTVFPGDWFLTDATNTNVCGPASPPLQNVPYKPWLVVATYDGVNSSLSVNGQTIISGCTQTGVFNQLTFASLPLAEWYSAAVLYGTLNSQQLIQLYTWGALCVWNEAGT